MSFLKFSIILFLFWVNIGFSQKVPEDTTRTDTLKFAHDTIIHDTALSIKDKMFIIITDTLQLANDTISEITTDTLQDTTQINHELILSAERGDEKAVIDLILKGANVNTQNEDSVTPLMYASQNGHLNIVKILIYNGADVNAKDLNGTPAIIAATRANNDSIVEILIRSGANVNIRDNNGATALLYASAYGYYVLVDMLLYYDVEVNAKANDSTDALILASLNGNKQIVELLLNHGADVNTRDNENFTPLIIASQQGYVKIVELLIEKGANINACNEYGLTALGIASQNGHKEVVELLLAKGADVNGADTLNKATTPLTLAIVYGDDDSVIKLLKKTRARNAFTLYFNKLSLGYNFLFNFDDILFGGGLGISEARYKFGINLGFNTRFSAKRILVQQKENFYYQLWERRFLLYLNIEKRFYAFQFNTFKLSPFLGLKEIYTFGGYRASKKKVNNQFIFAPQIGCYYFPNRIGIGLKLNYEYINFDLYENLSDKVSPHLVNFSFVCFINTGKYRRINKEVDWL